MSASCGAPPRRTYGALELFDRLLHVDEPLIGPAEGVDDVTVVGALLDRITLIG